MGRALPETWANYAVAEVSDLGVGEWFCLLKLPSGSLEIFSAETTQGFLRKTSEKGV